jgi:hypothetical protein
MPIVNCHHETFYFQLQDFPRSDSRSHEIIQSCNRTLASLLWLDPETKYDSHQDLVKGRLLQQILQASYSSTYGSLGSEDSLALDIKRVLTLGTGDVGSFSRKEGAQCTERPLAAPVVLH